MFILMLVVHLSQSVHLRLSVHLNEGVNTLAQVNALAQVNPQAQVNVLDRLLAVVNGEVVTMSDVRAARQLKLIAGSDTMTDDQLLDAVIERRLTIAEVARYTAAEPPAADVDARRKTWDASLPRGTTAAAALAAAGMRAEALAAWFRDDARLAAYLEQRFNAAAQPTRQQAMAYFQQHAADFAVGGIVPQFESVEPEVRRRVAADRRATRIRDWVQSLKQRAEIRKLK
jgi:hypothetical protein